MSCHEVLLNLFSKFVKLLVYFSFDFYQPKLLSNEKKSLKQPNLF